MAELSRSLNSFKEQLMRDKFLDRKKFQMILNESNNPILLSNLHKTGILHYLETPPKFFRQNLVSEFLLQAKLSADGKTVSSVIQGRLLQITERTIAEVFDLP